MLNKFFQSFNVKKDKNDDHSFESDLYNLIYEIIIADHEISEQEMTDAIKFGHDAIKAQIDAQNDLVNEVGKKETREYEKAVENEEKQIETFNKKLLDKKFVFEYCTTSKKNVLRGFHFQTKFKQSKYVNFTSK